MKHLKNRLKTLTAIIAVGGSFTASAQSLTVTNSLQLWLKADAGVTTNASGNVTAWNDQSGKNNHATQTDATLTPAFKANILNGKPVLRFDGADDYLEVTDSDSVSISGDITTFFVVKFDDFATFRAVWAKTMNNQPGPNDWYALPGSGVPRAYRGNGIGQNGSVDGGSALRAGSYLVVGWDMAGTNLTHYLAAQPTATGVITATVADADTSLLIGTRGDLVTKMKGDIAEILIYDTALSASDRVAVVNYLATKYNIQNLPPTVSLKTLPAGPNAAVGTTITATATASDSDGTVASVQFFINGGLFATATTPPYSARAVLETGGSYVLTARAFDEKGAQATSLPITLTVGATSAPALAVTNSLQLWLKADAGVTASGDGAVSAWTDSSGKGNSALQGDPTQAPTLVGNALNGKAVLRFDGDNDYLEVADSESISIAGDITSLFVVKMDDFATFRAVWAKTAGNLPAPNDWYTVPGAGTPRLYRGDGTGSSLGSVDGASSLTAGAFQIAGFSAAGTAITHYLNGGKNGTGTIAATLADGDTSLLIGTRGDFFTKLKGDLAEILIYNTALSDSERKQAELYLAGKYGLSIATPTNTPPTISLTAPVDGLTLSAPTNVTVTATAADSDGTIARVSFLLNGAVVASKTNAPFSTVISFPTADNATLTAIAVDNLGGSRTSNPVSLTITTTVHIPLPAASNLKLWLSADQGVTATGGSVSAWADQSGNLNNAFQIATNLQPQVVPNVANGKPVLRFDGDNDFLSVSNAPSIAIVGDVTTFFVINITDFDSYRAVWTKTAGNQPASFDWYTLPNTGVPRTFRGNGTDLGSLDGTTPLLAGSFAVVGFDMAGKTLRQYLNGDSNGETQIAATPGDSGAPLLIGTRGDQFTRMKGDIAEIVIYNTALSAADRASVVSYLGTKYGIAVTSGAAPVLAISRTAGSLTLSWPISVTGYALESSGVLSGTSWQPVTGVANNSVTVTVGSGTAFYRLKKQ